MTKSHLSSVAATAAGVLILLYLHPVVWCDGENHEKTSDEKLLEEVKRSEEEPRYDLVLSLIEKYLKEKTVRKNNNFPHENSTAKGCDKLTELSANANLQKLLYPTRGTYLSTELCLWKIRAPEGKIIELTINWISVEATEGCRWDRLEIFDGLLPDNASRFALLCGFVLPSQAYVTKTNAAILRFTSDKNIEYGGFQIDYRHIDAPIIQKLSPQITKPLKQTALKETGLNAAGPSLYSECNGEVKELKELVGTIKFPLSGDYDNNLHCQWRIIVPVGKVIQLTVTSIDIETSESCRGCCSLDSLSIHDGMEETSNRLARLCGTDPPLVPFTTTSNVVLVVFKSNGENGDEGFQLNYQAFQKNKPSEGICSGYTVDIRNSTGQLHSPGFETKQFPNNVKCKWHITAPQGQVINVRFDHLSLENDVACLYDSVSLYDGSNRSAPLAGKYCGFKLPPEFTSRGSDAYIVFVSDNSMSNGGFSLNWTFVDKNASNRKVNPGCDGQPAVLEGQNDGVFTSPNYGNGMIYPNGVKCSWRIVVSGTLRAFLRFEKFSLEPPLSAGTCYDVVKIYDGSNESANLIGSYCGINAPADLSASTNQVFVTFSSDRSTSATGFLARYSAKKETRYVAGGDCGISDIMPKIYSRIVGGVEATPHSWPWQISITFSGYEWQHWCGGSLLSKRWIITAAHCVHGYGTSSEFKVVIGEHNRLKDEGTEKEMDISSFILHEDYDPFTQDNDIALFKLPTEIEFNRYIKPICLPKEDVEPNTLCIATGWGDTKSTGNNTVLNQVYLPVISRIQCNQPTWYNGGLTDNMICAGFPEGRKDSCQGDSGGPFVCLSEGRWRLNGLTSWGMECAESNHPGVYTRVSRFLAWIQSKTGVTP